MVDSRPENQVHGTTLLGKGEVALPSTLDRTDLHHHTLSLASHPGGSSDIPGR